MKTYSVINPSDTVLVETDDFEALCLATWFASDGWYGLEEVDPDTLSAIEDGGEMPVFALNPGAAEAWWPEQFGVSLVDSAQRVSKARLVYVLAAYRYPAGYERTSMNTIVAHAHALAEANREDVP